MYHCCLKKANDIDICSVSSFSGEKERFEVMCFNCTKRLSCPGICTSLVKLLRVRFGYRPMLSDTLDNAIYMAAWDEKSRSKMRLHVISVMPPRHIRLLRLYGTGITQAQIGWVLGISQVAVSLQIKTVMRRLTKGFNRKEVYVLVDR